MRIFHWLFLLLFIALNGRAAWSHGGEDHGDEGEKTAVEAQSGATETELELRLEDVARSSNGISSPLIGATVRGFLKHADDGDLLSRITARPAKTPGVYRVSFNGNQTTYRFDKAGNYLVELNIQPAAKDAFTISVPFALSSAAKAEVAPRKSVLPWVLGALALIVAAILARQFAARRHGKTKSAAMLLLPALLFAQMTARVVAHEGEDHGAEATSNAPQSTAESVAPEIQSGEVSATVTENGVRVTLVARTRVVALSALAAGEVQLAPQTAKFLQIATAPVRVAQLASGIAFTGRIAPNPDGIARVASLVPGRVTRLNVAQGERVTRGQIVAIVESRAVGEAQSAFRQASARLRNARANLELVQQQARAGVFSRAPLEAARRAAAEAQGEVRVQQANVARARVALDSVTRTARVGGYANPALEAARAQSAQATAALKTAQAALSNARSSVQSGQIEVRRRQQLARAGTYRSRPIEEARRALVTAQSARAQAQSEVATTRANLNRAQTLAAEGIISQRDLEAARQAFDTASARLTSAQADESAAGLESQRQTQIGAANLNGVAEVQAAQTLLAAALADVRSRAAEVARAGEGVRLAQLALSRERAIFAQNIANRREIGAARGEGQSAQANLYKANRAAEIAAATLQRETDIFRSNLNNTSPLQAARAQYGQAQSDVEAARSVLNLLQSAPDGSVAVPVRAPLSGIVQSRDVALGELIGADAPLMTIVNLDTVALEAALFEADAARVRIGSPLSVTSDVAPGRRFRGRISFIGAEVDEQTRTLTARAIISNAGALRLGVFVRGQIETGHSAPALTVPDSAVLDDGAAKVVFVAKGERYERREVALGKASNGFVEVKSGLKQGEIVVSQGGAALRAQAARDG